MIGPLLHAGGGAPGVVAAISDGLTAAPASLVLSNNGTYDNAGTSGNWVNPASATIAAYYEVKLDVTSGSFDSGTTGSFLAMSSTRTWTRNTTGVVVFTLTWRAIATGSVVRTQTGVSTTAI